VVVNIALIAFSLNRGGLDSLLAMLTGGRDDSTVALRAFSNGDLDSAVNLAESAYRADNNNTAALMTWVRALVYRSYVDFDHETDLALALEAANRAAGGSVNNADVLAAQAFALQANGQPVEAVAVAERALALQPDHTLARTALALGYARVGSFEIARREAQSALDNDANTPAHFDAQRALAISTADLGNYSDAGDILDALINDHRGFIPIYFERALYARQVSDAARVENAYFTVLTLDEANIKARLRLCEYASDIGERDRAETYCQEVTTLAPTIPTAWYRLGRLDFLNGDFAAAQQRLNQCSTLQVRQNVPASERIFECWYLQGQAAEILGDCPSLLAIYNQFQVIATDPAIRQTWTYPPEGPALCR
jgi:tetratricopeptide (TPR) repeat protein